MHSRSDNLEIITCKETDEVIKELFETLFSRYQTCLEKSIKGSNFIFEGADLLYYKCSKISLNYDGLYIDSLNWIKSKKAAMRPKKYWWWICSKYCNKCTIS